MVRRFTGALYLLPHPYMERILNLLGLEKRGKPVDFPCIVRFTEGNVRVSVLEIPLLCGHYGYAANIEYHLKEPDKWIAIGSFRDFNLDESITVLQQAKVCIDNLQRE